MERSGQCRSILHMEPGCCMSEQEEWMESVRVLLLQFTMCKGEVFDCQDELVRSGSFESLSQIDLVHKSSLKMQMERLDNLLALRAKLNMRIKLAEGIKEKLRKKLSRL